MKNFIITLVMAVMSLPSIASHNENDILRLYIENEYGAVKEVFQAENCIEITTINYRISICGSLIVAIWDVNSNNEIDIPINKRNIDSEINSYYTYTTVADKTGTYLRVNRFDGSHEYKFYFEEYYQKADGTIVYYNNSETVTIKNNFITLDNSTFKLLF